MARKTIKQMREEEEEIISQVSKKTEIESNNQKALFKNIEIEKKGNLRETVRYNVQNLFYEYENFK